MESLHVYYEDVENMYLFIVLVAQRVDQLYRGARPRVEVASGEKPTVVAMREVLNGRIRYTHKKEIERPEVKAQSMSISL